jgi:hypothetical protein
VIDYLSYCIKWKSLKASAKYPLGNIWFRLKPEIRALNSELNIGRTDRPETQEGELLSERAVNVTGGGEGRGCGLQ